MNGSSLSGSGDQFNLQRDNVHYSTPYVGGSAEVSSQEVRRSGRSGVGGPWMTKLADEANKSTWDDISTLRNGSFRYTPSGSGLRRVPQPSPPTHLRSKIADLLSMEDGGLKSNAVFGVANHPSTEWPNCAWSTGRFKILTIITTIYKMSFILRANLASYRII